MTDDELKGLFDGLRQDTTALRQDNVGIRGELAALRQDNSEVRGDLGAIHGEIAELRQDTAVIRQEAVAAHTETRRHFDIALRDVRDELRLVAESVVHTREEVSRTGVALTERLEHGLADTQSMIKFSHAELDRRVRTLEDAVADLQARVERLESSPTH